MDPALAFILGSDPALALILDSDPALAFISDPGFGSGLFLKNKFKFALFFLKAQRIFQPYLNCISSKICKKANFLKSVHSYCFIFVNWKQSLT